MKIAKTKALNPAQTKAVLSETYPIYLQAGAGSGKTHVLIEKVISVLENDPAADLSKMAIITYTNKATDELASRLQTALYQHWLRHRESETADKIRKQISLCKMVQISTIHGFCEQIISDFGHVIDLPNTFSVRNFRQSITEITLRQINLAGDKEILKNIPQHTLLQMVQELLNIVTNKGISLANLDLETLEFDTEKNDFYNKFKPVFLRICAKVASELETLKQDETALSADDFIIYALKVLEDDYALKCVTKQYPYVFIDELQDTSFEQFSLLQKLITAGVKAFVIGDKKQSIYGFRGADVENANRIEEIAGLHGKIDLNTNYRTDPALLEKVNKIFMQDFCYEKETLAFPRQPLASGLTTDSYEKPLQMRYKESVKSIIDGLGQDGISYGEIAVLFRRNFELKQVADQLKAKHIPVEVMGGKGFYATVEIVDTFKVLYALLHKSPSAMLEARNTFYCRSITQSGGEFTFEDFLNEMENVLKARPIDSILAALFEKSNAFAYLRNKGQYQAVANLVKLADKAKAMVISENIKPLQFVEHLNFMIVSNREEDEAEVSKEDRAKGVVTLYTIHKAKGLEFPVVIVPYCDLSLVRPKSQPKVIFRMENEKPTLAFYPEWFKREGHVDADYEVALTVSIRSALEEELRIFYVACTRAKHMLILSCRWDEKQMMKPDKVSWAKWAKSVKLEE